MASGASAHRGPHSPTVTEARLTIPATASLAEAVTDWQHIDEELRKRGLEPSLRATVVPTHWGPHQAELALDLAAVPRPRSHAPPRGADLALAS